MNFKRALIISRPAAWTWTTGMFLVGMGNFSNFTIISVIEFLFMLFPINFLIYGLNDIYDKKSDRSNPYKDGIQGTKVKEKEVKQIKTISIIISISFFLVSLFSKNIWNILASGLLILGAYVYSAPPIRLKSKPIIDSIFGGIGYFVPALIAFTTYNTIDKVPWIYLILALPLIGGHLIFALRDINYDKKAKIKTTGVILGKRKTMIIVAILDLITFFFMKDLFLKALLLISALSIMVMSTFILKKEKYLSILIGDIYFSLNLACVYFILKANLI